MSQQPQYVKNTNVPKPDSWLWKIGNNWRYSGKSGECYCPLKYDEEKQLKDLQLFSAMMELLKKPVEQLDYVEYKQGFFVPTKTGEGDTLLWVYEKNEEEKAKKKVENTIKYAGSNQQTQGTNTTASGGGGGTQQTILKTPTINTNTSTAPQQMVSSANILSTNFITTYTDPQWVDGDNAKVLESQGYNYLPSSISHPNVRVEDVHDGDEIVGERYLFLMGRIINVKISD